MDEKIRGMEAMTDEIKPAVEEKTQDEPKKPTRKTAVKSAE